MTPVLAGVSEVSESTLDHTGSAPIETLKEGGGQNRMPIGAQSSSTRIMNLQKVTSLDRLTWKQRLYLFLEDETR